MYNEPERLEDRSGSVGGETLSPGARLEEFEIEGELGAGGFGVTYLAHDVSLGRRVAVKEYFPLHWSSRHGDGSVGPRSAGHAESYAWGLSRFVEEARILAQPGLRHPNLVQVHRFIEENGTAYLVTEFVEGRSLKEALDSDGAWREARVRDLLSGLLDGLAAVHGAGLLHRDIKPANVMLRGAEEAPVLIDFGAARYASGEKSGTLTDVLTPGYAPFEQYHTKGRQGAWTDVYALGAVAYHALTGTRPDEAPSRKDEDLLRPVGEASAYPVSEGLSSAVDAALAVRASDRPQSVEEWRRLLEVPAVAGSMGSARRRWAGASGGDRRKKPSWRGWRLGVASAGAVVLLLVVVLFADRWGTASRSEGGVVEATPEECSEDLGVLAEPRYTRAGEWDRGCAEVDGTFTLYYSFTLDRARRVAVRLVSQSQIGMWLVLTSESGDLWMDAHGRDHGIDVQARTEWETLPRGKYTIEIMTTGAPPGVLTAEPDEAWAVRAVGAPFWLRLTLGDLGE